MTRRVRAACVALAALLCAGCGVRPSGVITGGPAPTERAGEVTLYFLTGATLTPALRPARRPVQATEVLASLARGPSGDERAARLSSEVPAGLGPLGVGPGPSGTLRVAVSVDVATLSDQAVDQIVCTVRDALPATAPVTLTGAGRTRGPRLCPLTGGGPGPALPGPPVVPSP